MEIVLRALNDLDILCDPINNGIASKKMIYELTKRYLKQQDKDYLKGLSKQEQEIYIKENMKNYILTHSHRLEKNFKRENLEIRNIIHSFVTKKDKESYYLLLYFLSSLNNHLVNGSQIYTEWISTTNNFDSMYKYYENQKEHKVAAIILPTNGVYNEDTLAVNVSSKDNIEKIKCLSKKIKTADVFDFIKLIQNDKELEKISNELFHYYIFNRTSSNFMGYNFSSSDHEFCIYNYIHPKYIKSILEQIQIDIICADRFNINYLSLSKEQQKRELILLKEKLKKHILKTNDSHMLYLFEQLYIENKNINLISSTQEEKEKNIKIRNKIINTSLHIPSSIIKR